MRRSKYRGSTANERIAWPPLTTSSSLTRTGDRGQFVYAQTVVGSTRRLVFLGVCTTLPNGLLATNVKTISSRLRVAGQWLWWCRLISAAHFSSRKRGATPPWRRKHPASLRSRRRSECTYGGDSGGVSARLGHSCYVRARIVRIQIYRIVLSRRSGVPIDPSAVNSIAPYRRPWLPTPEQAAAAKANGDEEPPALVGSNTHSLIIRLHDARIN
jgi:hypothetical protein